MADPEAIYNWRRLDDRITTSGQPTEQQLADIQALGVRHIVNLGLHTHEKALPDEAASVARLGMTYIHIPVDFQNPTDQDFDQFCAVMEQLKEVPVHVHCIANARVSAFSTAIAATCWAWTRHRHVPRWKRSGSQTPSGRHLSHGEARGAINDNRYQWNGSRHPSLIPNILQADGEQDGSPKRQSHTY